MTESNALDEQLLEEQLLDSVFTAITDHEINSILTVLAYVVGDVLADASDAIYDGEVFEEFVAATLSAYKHLCKPTDAYTN